MAKAREAAAATLAAGNAGPLLLVESLQRFRPLAQLGEAEFLADWAQKPGLKERELEAGRLAEMAEEARRSPAHWQPFCPSRRRRRRFRA